MRILLALATTLRLLASTVEDVSTDSGAPVEQVETTEEALEEKQLSETPSEVQSEDEKLVEESQEEFGKGSTPDLPPPRKTLWRNLTFLVFSLVSLVCGIAAVGNNPGRGA